MVSSWEPDRVLFIWILYTKGLWYIDRHSTDVLVDIGRLSTDMHVARLLDL